MIFVGKGRQRRKGQRADEMWSGGDGTDCKRACLYRLPQTEGWHEKISAGLQGAAEETMA
jgi:hypothetical protein